MHIAYRQATTGSVQIVCGVDQRRIGDDRPAERAQQRESLLYKAKAKAKTSQFTVHRAASRPPGGAQPGSRLEATLHESMHTPPW